VYPALESEALIAAGKFSPDSGDRRSASKLLPPSTVAVGLAHERHGATVTPPWTP